MLSILNNPELYVILRIYRERANPRLTQIRLGEFVGVSDKTIRNWEDDLSVPTAQNFRKRKLNDAANADIVTEDLRQL